MTLEKIGKLVYKIETSKTMKYCVYALGVFVVFCFIGFIWNYITLGFDF